LSIVGDRIEFNFFGVDNELGDHNGLVGGDFGRKLQKVG
jgi:hypothetical protein